MMLFSIIIPHKNIPKLLQRCVDSIPLRSDIEIIIVDDNSDTEIVDFENFPGQNINNVKHIFTKEGKGAGYARNIGLKHATGKWLIFADADDIFMPGIREILNKEYFDEDIDLLYYNVCSKDTDTLTDNNECSFFTKSIQESINNPTSIKYKIEVPWGKVVSKKLIEKYNIQFDETPCANDTKFSVFCDYYSSKIEITSELGYCWMTRKDSLWHNKNLNWTKTRMDVMLRIASFMKREKSYNEMNKYFGKAYHFMIMIQSFSQKEFIKSMASYAWAKKDIRMLSIDLPLQILHYITK